MSGPAEEPRAAQSSLPPFLRKLWMMVNDASAEGIIGWNSAGDGFVISDQVRFVTDLLPTYFKHNNMASFVRQLNFYDFHKVSDLCGARIEFAHPYFLKDLPETLAFITRKPSNATDKPRRSEEVVELLADVKELKSKHHRVESELQKLRRENATLWEEINSLRYKHAKQAKVIYKLIHFLVSYMHSDKTGGRRGKATLHGSPKLLQIDYRGRKRGSSGETIESLLEESSRDSQEADSDYTVSYPPGPIEELSDTEADAGAYTVRFPKGGEIEKLLEPADEVEPLNLTRRPVDPADVVAEVPEPIPTFRIHRSAPGEYVLLKSGDQRATPDVGANRPKIGKRTTVVSKSSGKPGRDDLPAPAATKPKRKQSQPVRAVPAKPEAVPAEPVAAPAEPEPSAAAAAAEWGADALGSYIESTDSKLDSLRDILERLDADALDDRDDLSQIRWELEDELAKLPSVASGDPAANLEALLGE